MTLKNHCPEELDKIIRGLSGPAHQNGMSTSFACSALYVYEAGGTMPENDRKCLVSSGLLCRSYPSVNGFALLKAFEARSSRFYLWAEDRANAARKAAQAAADTPCPATPK